MNEVIVEVQNEFIQILIDMGCDVSVMPSNQIELGVLWIKYSWAVFLLGISIKSMLSLIKAFVGGTRY